MGGVYEEGRMKSLFIERVFPNLRQSVRAYWGGDKRAELTTLVKYAASLMTLKGPTAGPPQTCKKKCGRDTSQEITVARPVAS